MDFNLHELLTLVGRLDDAAGTEMPRERFRRFLLDRVTSVAEIAAMLRQSEERLGDQYARARQDLVILLGRHLGFDTTFGSYESLPGAVRLEGHWRSRRQARIAIEVRGEQTGDRDGETLARTVAALSASLPPEPGERWVGLCVTTAYYTGARQLDAQLARRPARDIRSISAGSLLWLAEMAAEERVSHSDVVRLLTSGPDSDFMVNLMRRLTESVAGGRGTDASSSAVHEVKAIADGPPRLSIVARPERETDTGFWLVTLLHDETATPEQLLDAVIGRRQVLGISDTGTPPPQAREGDWVCFLIADVGIVGHGQLDEKELFKRMHASVSYT
ncbi:MAG: hypothetical protein ABL982_05030, partial [Vicinamibacterales bacterium]